MKYIFAILLILSILPLIAPQPVAAQDGISIEASRATTEFPNTLTFAMRVRSEAPLERVVLEYGVESRTCGTVTARAFPKVGAVTFADVAWTWDMRQSGSEPPGAEIWYRWRITDSAGNSFVSEDQRVTWIDPNHGWQNISEGLITLHWYRYPPEFAQELLDAAVVGLEQLSRDTGVVPQESIDLYIYANTEDMLNAVLYVPGWAGGLAFPEHNVVMIGITPDEMEWGKSTIIHELTHVLVGQLTFSCLSSVPTWLNEGIAVYSEGELDPQLATQLDYAIRANDLPALRSLGNGFGGHVGRVTTSYAQSYSVVNYLVANFGADNLLSLFAALRDGGRIDEALQATYGFQLNELDNRWRASIGVPPLPADVLDQAVAGLPTPAPTGAPLVGPPAGAPLTLAVPTIEPTAVAVVAPTEAPPQPTTADSVTENAVTTSEVVAVPDDSSASTPSAVIAPARPMFGVQLLGAAATFLVGLALSALSITKLLASR